ncbi:MAG TPA: SLC13 family permease [Alphaproteobacteria bacterium]|nr:SLC13 family permease [Alphaproteobacteria bacterium]
MTVDQALAISLVIGALGLFAWGRWRYDLVALIALAAGLAMGVVPADQAFAGFGHPAVITVVAVLIVSRALTLSGAVDGLAKATLPTAGPVWLQVGALSIAVAMMSAFMNNVGALALIMPAAIAAAKKSERSPSLILMPIAFASMLGGMITLIGTPPNLLVAAYRAEAVGRPFAMFDFAPVGGVVAIVGIVFVALVGWRLIPRGARADPKDRFDIAGYVMEARLPDDSAHAGKSVGEIDALLEKDDVDALGIVRAKHEIPWSATWERVAGGDVLILEGTPDALKVAIDGLKLELPADDAPPAPHLESEEMSIVEAVVMPRALIDGLTAEEIRLRSRYDISLLAVARAGSRHRGRLKSFRFTAGDVLLLRGPTRQVNSAMSMLGLLPLASRGVGLGRPGRALAAVAITLTALVASALSLAPTAVCFLGAVIVLILSRCIRLGESYDAIDWPIVVLLGAMLPVGGALESTGATKFLADLFLSAGDRISPILMLALVLILTMTISDIVNNAATAVMMAPLAVGIARGLEVNPDGFLMAVAIGASCAFLTPIGHQNNTLVMGPGGYRFGDYWPMGLPLEIIVVATALPAILVIWPL